MKTAVYLRNYHGYVLILTLNYWNNNTIYMEFACYVYVISAWAYDFHINRYECRTKFNELSYGEFFCWQYNSYVLL